jgi:phospholipid/cholesterol/gamma-HCH transport system substrate-binding protein
VKRAISKHASDFAFLAILVVIGLGVGGYILSQQRFYLPGWVPGIGTEFVTLHGEFSNAKSVAPGQGQSVTIAGVNVGEITAVELVEGRARVEMRIRSKYAPKVRKDASLLLRPKTGLEDMVIEMAPGTGERAPDGYTVPIRNTLPDVKVDQILASLDRDTRDYLRLLLEAGGDGLRDSGDDAAAAFKRFEPGARELRRITGALETRRGNIRRSISNLRLLVEAVAEKDDQLGQLVDSSNAALRTFTSQDRALRSTLQKLPDTLVSTRTALERTGRLAEALGPTLERLRPTARQLGPSLRQVRPFLRETTPIFERQLRPFARDVLPTLRTLSPASRDLARVLPDLDSTMGVLNRLTNTLAYNPPGSEEGYLFWASWLNHISATMFGTQDAHGPIRRGTVMVSCPTSQVLETVIAADPRLGMLTQLTGLPFPGEICPRQGG